MTTETTVVLALDVVLALLSRAAEISTMIQSLNAQGRTTFTAEEWALVQGPNDVARQRLADEIARREAEAAAAVGPTP